MDRNIIIDRLQFLESNLMKASRLKHDISIIEESLIYEKKRTIIKVEKFDALHKEEFIKSKVGEKPIHPKKLLAVVVPVYLKKKREYETALEQYNIALNVANQEYYSVFQKERRDLIEQDNREREKAIHDLELKLECIKNEFEATITLINQDDILGRSLKNTSDIRLLIDIFDNKRADSIKEGVNVLFEDKHRKKMEELQAEQVRLTQEAKEAAESAADSAEEAIGIAKEALERADEAYSKAQDAYREAQDAYSEARNAYDEATKN